MQYRTLGRTGIKVSEVGFGAWAIGGGWGPKNDDDSVAALHKALDLGCTFIDTAQVYGNGHSERLIARVFKERGERVTVSTKVPPQNNIWGPRPGTDIRDAFPADWLIERAEMSLRNLEMDAIDIYQLHTWCPTWDKETEWYEALVKLREQGKIRYIGISVSDHRPGEANPHIEVGRIDTIQVIYNILDQSPETELFPFAQKHQVGIINRVPLASGALTGKWTKETKFPPGDWRGEWKTRDWLLNKVEQVERLRFLERDGMSMTMAALKYVLAHPAVSVAIPGVRNVQQAEVNLSVSDSNPLEPATVERLREMYAQGLLGRDTSAG